MHIGQSVLCKHNEIVQEGKVQKIYFEDLDIKLENGETIRRKFWEIRKIEIKNDL